MSNVLTYRHFMVTDIKIITRDKSLFLFLFIPFLMLAFLHWAVPPIAQFYPQLTEYYALVLGLMAVVISVFPGFIMAFIVIDEKEQNVVKVFRIVPVSFACIVYARIALTFLMGFVYSFLILSFSGLVNLTTIQILQVSVLCAFLGPVSALIMLSAVDNKIEGMTFMKGLNFIWIIPVAHFFIESQWKYFFAIIPDYWTLQIIYKENVSTWVFIIGLAYHSTILHLAAKIFIRKTSTS